MMIKIALLSCNNRVTNVIDLGEYKPVAMIYEKRYFVTMVIRDIPYVQNPKRGDLV